MSRDPGEKENRVAAEPEKVAELRALLEKSRWSDGNEESGKPEGMGDVEGG